MSRVDQALTPSLSRAARRDCMGLVLRESSPVRTVLPGARLARVVARRRVVPEFLRSSTSSGV